MSNETVLNTNNLSNDPEIARKQMFENEIFVSIQNKYKTGHSYKRDPREGLFRISQLPYCSRKLVFSNLLGWDADSYMQEAAEAGTMIHEIMQSALRENDNYQVLDLSDLKIEDEVEFTYKSILIKGHIDILVAVFMGKTFIIDIKTINGIENFDRYGPKKHHEWQVYLYCYALMQKIPSLKPENVILVLWYINRKNNTGDILDVINKDSSRFHYFEFNQVKTTELLQKAELNFHLTVSGTIPDIDAEEWECKNSKITCQYYELCYPIAQKSIKNIENITLDSIKEKIETPQNYQRLDLLAIRTENGLYYTTFAFEENTKTAKARLCVFNEMGTDKVFNDWIPFSQSETKLIPLDLKTIIYENINIFKSNTALLLKNEQIEQIFSSENKGIKVNTLIIEKWLATKKFPQLEEVLNQKTAVINSKLFLMYKLFIKNN